MVISYSGFDLKSVLLLRLPTLLEREVSCFACQARTALRIACLAASRAVRVFEKECVVPELLGLFVALVVAGWHGRTLTREFVHVNKKSCNTTQKEAALGGRSFLPLVLLSFFWADPEL
jgi:hypothetical protein